MKRLRPLCALILTLSVARAAEDLTVLPPAIDGVAPTALLETQLKKLAYAALDRREAEYEQLKTPNEIAARQKSRRAIFLAAIGGLPERTPLQARVTGRRSEAARGDDGDLPKDRSGRGRSRTATELPAAGSQGGAGSRGETGDQMMSKLPGSALGPWIAVPLRKAGASVPKGRKPVSGGAVPR